MFQNTIISNELSIYKFFKQLNFDLYCKRQKISIRYFFYAYLLLA